MNPITAAILAGGFGTRLCSVVADRPKVLAPVQGRPWIDFLLDRLADAGLREVILLTGHGGEQVRDALGEAYAGLGLHYSQEPEPLGTAGALRHALPEIRSSQVLLLNGDSLVDLDLAAFSGVHQKHGASLSLVLARVPDASRFGRVRLARDGRIIAFEEKQSRGAGWINAGVYLLRRELIEEIPSGRFVSLEREMFPQWLERGSMFGYCCPGAFLDIGTPESFAEAERFVAAPLPT